MSDWFRQKRVRWIIETIRIYNYINREHVEKKFGVSTPQASKDLQDALKECPAISYNKASKRYEFDSHPEPTQP
jgi:hypothetical protein